MFPLFKSFCAFLFPVALGSVITIPSGVQERGNGIGNNEKHFKEFTLDLLKHSDLDEFSVEKGAAISSPFGVGFMLANINEKVWNVSNEGVEKVLHSGGGKVADEYQALIDKLQKSQMSISSTLFMRDQNASFKFPEGSRKLRTETKLVDFTEDWRNTWLTMNARIANKTNGILDDQLIPKGGWWGGAFYYFTMGAFINTNHFRGAWNSTWADIGPKQFYDGLTVPFFQTEGSFPFMETENFTAVAVPLKDGKKSVIFALPKVPIVPFLKMDMPSLVEAGSPKSWKTQRTRTIQIPRLNITLLDQHFKKIEALGVNYTFCVDEPSSEEVAQKKGQFFMGPIVQSHHVLANPDYFEVATATGSSLNSEERMREEGIFHGPPPQSEEDEEDEQGSEDGSERSQFVLPMEMDAKLVKALVEGQIDLKEPDVTLLTTDKKKNDTLTASASSVEELISAVPAGFNISSLVGNKNETSSEEDVVDMGKLLMQMSTTPRAESTPSVTPEPLPENTIRFDRPFFWYLYDEEMGPLYFGTVNSLATYQREYGIETEEDLWLYDAYKTLLWNCP